MIFQSARLNTKPDEAAAFLHRLDNRYHLHETKYLNDGKVRQRLGEISLHECLEECDDNTAGFYTLLSWLADEKTEYLDRYCKQPVECHGNYIDGTNTRLVKFDTLYVSLTDHPISKHSVAVWGEREQDDGEKACLQESEDKGRNQEVAVALTETERRITFLKQLLADEESRLSRINEFGMSGG